MKMRLSFYLMFVVYGFACCGVVPSDFKSTHDEHLDSEGIPTSKITNESILILENAGSQNTSNSTLFDHHPIHTSEELVPDFHNISDLRLVENSIPEEDLSAKKLSKGSSRSKKKSPKDSKHFKKLSQEKIHHAGVNDILLDNHTLETRHLETHHKADEDSKINGLVTDHFSDHHPIKNGQEMEDLKTRARADDHTSVAHDLQIDHKAEDSNIHGSLDDHSLDTHNLPTHNKSEEFKKLGVDAIHPLETHALQADHKIEDLEIHDGVDVHSAESGHLQTVHQNEGFKIHGLDDDHSSKGHPLQIDHQNEGSEVHDRVDDHSSESVHLQVDHQNESLKVHGLDNDHSSEVISLQTDHKTESSKIFASVDDHSVVDQRLQKDNKIVEIFKNHSSNDEHSTDTHSSRADHKFDNLNIHGSIEENFSEPDQAVEDFSEISKNVSKTHDETESVTANLDEKPDHSRNFATTSEHIMLKITDSVWNNEDKNFVTQKIDNENRAADSKHDVNDVNQDFLNTFQSADLVNSTSDLLLDWNNSTQDTKNESTNNLIDLSNSIENVTHDANNFSQDNLNISVPSLSRDIFSPVRNLSVDFKNVIEEDVNNSEVLQSKNLTKAVNEVKNTISEDLINVPRSTAEFTTDLHDLPKTTESEQNNLNEAESSNNIIRRTVSGITNSKLFLNIHNSFMRLNPNGKPISAKVNREGDTPEMDLSLSEGPAASNKNGENSNNPDGINIKSESIDAAENKTSQGVLSSLGLGFIMNSELAKNAASAMEVFNFTDSALTDHIIDDQNDMHDLLDIRSSVVDDNNHSSSEQSNAVVGTGSSKVGSENSKLDKEKSSAVSLEQSQESSNAVIKDKLNEVDKQDIGPLSEFSGRNGSLKVPTSTTLNSTKELSNITMDPAALFNNTIEFEATNSGVNPDIKNTSEADAKCPPPGICIFWFFAQDTCSVNSHCLGSRICCRIGCSKTCVEV